MGIEHVNPDTLAAPRGFSHATVAAGRVVFLAGQTALDRNGHLVAGGVVAQFEVALSNLLTALQAAGGTPGDLASLTIYIVDVDDYQANAHEIGRVWKRLVGARYPAMAGVGVTRLWQPDALVEVQGFAVLGS
jgi:enamine deaminase RidA (YjgF/YER057c/UK114 family)